MIPKMLSETQSIKDKIDEIVKKKKDAEAKKKEDDFADEEPDTAVDAKEDIPDEEEKDPVDKTDSEEDTEDKPKVDKDIGDYRKSDAEDSDRPSVWSPFAKKIVADMDVYFEKIGEQQPTRVVAIKFRNEIEDKLDDGKEKNNVIKFFNTKFKLPGVSTKAWNYFAESVYDPKDFEGTYPQVLDKMEKKYGHIEAWKAMIDGERKRLASGKSIMDMNEN